jgi:hypothetical protein
MISCINLEQDFCSELARLITCEDLITFSRHESFEACQCSVLLLKRKSVLVSVSF